MPDANGKNDARNVSTTRGIKGGYAFCAPEGTPVPKSLYDLKDSTFKNVGFVSSDGWKEGLDSSSESITDMNGDVVDTYDGEWTETLSMKLLEMDTEPLAVQYGHDNVTETDKEIIVDHN